MKRFIFLLIITLLPVMAASKNSGKLATDMRMMLTAMEAIQKGGFYNCTSCMEDGVKQLKKGLDSMHSMDAKSFLPQHQAYAFKFAQKRAKMIEMYADDLVLSLKEQNQEEALEDYALILKQCTSCHARMRR